MKFIIETATVQYLDDRKVIFLPDQLKGDYHNGTFYFNNTPYYKDALIRSLKRARYLYSTLKNYSYQKDYDFVIKIVREEN
jgi:hypothetical protein